MVLSLTACGRNDRDIVLAGTNEPVPTNSVNAPAGDNDAPDAHEGHPLVGTWFYDSEWESSYWMFNDDGTGGMGARPTLGEELFMGFSFDFEWTADDETVFVALEMFGQQMVETFSYVLDGNVLTFAADAEDDYFSMIRYDGVFERPAAFDMSDMMDMIGGFGDAMGDVDWFLDGMNYETHDPDLVGSWRYYSGLYAYTWTFRGNGWGELLVVSGEALSISFSSRSLQWERYGDFLTIDTTSYFGDSGAVDVWNYVVDGNTLILTNNYGTKTLVRDN